MTWLVLWDIDHTLISMCGSGRDLFGAAFEQVTGVRMRQQAAVDGMTDRVIFRETAALHGLTTTRKDFESFAVALGAQHLNRAVEIRERGHALPGAASALRALAGVPGMRQTVVTGNIRVSAEVKLRVFGLDGPIVWDIGAYGEDSDTRPPLVQAALRRARHSESEGRVVLIGDTPADVAGALANNVRVIGVASGRSSEADLRAAGAITTLPDLTDNELVMKLVIADDSFT
ncbi:haloacid dehalogenase-like hydrolase [Streptomyces sp. B6B3]|uniref:HAD family hydrolase n=1 Tax=Streptomyces sp. B6B3 TaxID=3153570 RepID=UPI00325F5273